MATVLLLEPDVRLAAGYRAGLMSGGYRVDHATNAQDAICLADGHQPDVVVLELQLTAHSGIEFLYEFRSYADWQAVPAIILSHVPQATMAASQDTLQRHLGVRQYLYKPRTSLRVLRYSVAAVLTPELPAAMVSGAGKQ